MWHAADHHGGRIGYAPAIAVVITFCTGILLVPSLTTSIFSGQGGQASFPGLSRFMRR